MTRRLRTWIDVKMTFWERVRFLFGQKLSVDISAIDDDGKGFLRHEYVCWIGKELPSDVNWISDEKVKL